MPFYEVIFETGSKSVAFAESDEEMAEGLKIQHNRAKSGMPGGPTGHPAERVTAVLVYDKHPADFGSDLSFSKDVAEKTVSDIISKLADENGVVAKYELAQAILETSNALVPREDQDRHSSQYKAKEKRALDSSLWGEK